MKAHQVDAGAPDGVLLVALQQEKFLPTPLTSANFLAQNIFTTWAVNADRAG